MKSNLRETPVSVVARQWNRAIRYARKRLLRFLSGSWRERFGGFLAVRRFLALSVPMPGRTVLVVEPNEYHAEILPGYCDYFRQLGYAVVLLVRERNAGRLAFSRISSSERPVTFVMGSAAMRRCMRSVRLRDFELVFISSAIFSQVHGHFGHFLGFVGKTPRARCGYLAVLHSPALSISALDSGLLEWGRVATLNGYSCGDRRAPMVNPHYFGPRRAYSRSGIATFVTVGEATPANRDFGQLRDALAHLESRGVRNYRVIVVGARPMPELASAAPGMVFEMGRIGFPELYEVLDDARFLLPLLDSTNGQHRRYLAGQSSGSFQLALGFGLVPVVDEEFAEAYGFDSGSAVTYGSRALLEGMLSAISLGEDKYSNLRQGVVALAGRVRGRSLRNLSAMLRSVGSEPRLPADVLEHVQG